MDTALVRRRLAEERERLLKEISQQEILGKENTGYATHMADDASEVYEQAKNLALREHLERMLNQVEAALARLDAGTYGICEDCGEPIDPARLEALPYATLCLECQQRREEVT